MFVHWNGGYTSHPPFNKMWASALYFYFTTSCILIYPTLNCLATFCSSGNTNTMCMPLQCISSIFSTWDIIHAGVTSIVLVCSPTIILERHSKNAHQHFALLLPHPLCSLLQILYPLLQSVYEALDSSRSRTFFYLGGAVKLLSIILFRKLSNHSW